MIKLIVGTFDKGGCPMIPAMSIWNGMDGDHVPLAR